MDMTALLTRSKDSRAVNFNGIPCLDNGEVLLSVKPNDRLEIRPIWDDPIDEIEGPLYAQYISKHPNYNAVFARKTVVAMLTRAAHELPSQYKLIVRAGHRPKDVQLELLHMVAHKHKLENPGVSEHEAITYARVFVSDPAVKLPPHCCGAAVDVDVLDVKSGKLLDFGCPVNTDSSIAFLHSSKITSSQKANRIMLLKVMLRAGFASYYAEWWHFSYGDQLWAHFYNQKNALYGVIEPDV